jgi:hypothetical protein
VWQWVWPAVLGTALAVLLVVAMVQTFASPKTSAVACGNYQNSSDPTTSLSADVSAVARYHSSVGHIRRGLEEWACYA